MSAAAQEHEPESRYPVDAMEALRRKRSDLGGDTSLPAATLLPPARTGGRFDVVAQVRLLGCFPTAAWRADPALPDFVSYHTFRIGYYAAAECVITDAEGTETGLVLVINQGDGDCNTGYWGGVFERHVPHRCVARMRSVGDMETAVREVEGIVGFVPYAEGEDHVDGAAGLDNEGGEECPPGIICFPRFKSNEKEEESEEEEDARIEYFSGLFPGLCQTQLEKILGITMGRMMQAREWRMLPKSLRNYGNCH